ncbi:MAG: transferase family-domain-containing protein [Linnemannia elongata]|nr:MAG: transferase family-domain-containing protein [Linnemannia elongata]
MSPQRTLHEREKIANHHRHTQGGMSSPLSSSRSPSYTAASSRSSPQTKLRHRQLVQPITPTELELVPDQTTGGEARQYPRVELSSLDLAKPRIYTRLLYFFEATQQQQGSFGRPTTTSTSVNDASLSAKGVTNNNNNNNNNNTSSSSSVSSSTFATTLSPPASPAGSSSSSSAKGNAKKPNSGSSSKSRHHYHYHSSPFMDPMLLQASLALVLSDFFPLAGRLCSNTNNNNRSLDLNHAGATTAAAAAAAGPSSSSSSATIPTPATSSTPAPSTTNYKSNSRRPFIECNDRGVLFVVADTTASMAQIRHGGYQDAILPPQLFPVGLYPASLLDPPLLGIQLTYTSDQSLIMGVAMDSSVLDATSWISFMEAWSKMTQGKDFGPYPILDRTFLEIHGDPYLASAVYRHQRINDSPPPPILFDNSLDNALDRGLGELEVTTTEDEDDDDDDDDEEEDDSSNLQRTQKLMESISEDSGKGTALDTTPTDTAVSIPRVVIGDVEHLEGPIEGISEQQKQQQQQQQQQGRAGGRRSRRRQKSHNSGMDAVVGGQETEGGNLHLFHFSPQQLDAIKKLASEQNIAAAACAADDKEISDKWVSTGDSLVAYLWKMSTITRRMEPDCKMMCGLVMDIRNRVAPPIPEGYIGNAILSIFVQMPVHSLLTTPLSLPSRLLRDELMLQSPEQLKSAISWIQRQENPHLIETTSNNPFGKDFMVWSFRKLNMYSPDFGQGPPVKVRIGRGGFGGGEGMCVIMDSEPVMGGVNRGSGGSGVDVYLGLQGEHLRDFEMVHRGFMEGLLEPGGSGSGSGGVGSSSGDWEIV